MMYNIELLLVVVVVMMMTMTWESNSYVRTDLS